MNRLLVCGVATLLGCSVDGTPQISNLSIASPISKSGAQLLVSGELEVLDNGGVNDLSGSFVFVSETTTTPAFKLALTPGAESAPIRGVVQFALPIGGDSTPGSYTVQVTLTDGKDGHQSNLLEAPLVIQ